MAARYVERALGERGTAELTRLAGPDLLERVMEPGGWCELEHALTLASAAARVCGERDIGRRAGEECFRDHVASGVGELLRATGSLHAALRDAAEFAHKMSSAAHHILVEEDRLCVIEIHCPDSVPGDVFLCGFKRRQTRIDEIAEHFIDRMRELGGECDFAADIAQPYTLRVIMDIFGIPERDEPMMMDLTQGIFGSADPEFLGDAYDPQARLMQSLTSVVSYFNELTADRRACPADDLATVIANGQVQGCPMGDAERLWYYIIVATAGHDTTSFALSGGVEALLRDPAQLDTLRIGGEDLMVGAADEFIRWTSPVRHFLRYATEPTTIRGVDIEAGERVLLSYPSANRDEAVFVDPMRFDVSRPDADRLLSFGVGTHFCLGAQFARSEIRTFLARLVVQLAEIEPAGPAQWSESYFVSGVKHLPIRYRFH